MTLYWIRGITSNNPLVIKYVSHQTEVNRAAREVFNGRHKGHFPNQTKKFDANNDLLLFSTEDITLRGFHKDELQEETED